MRAHNQRDVPLGYSAKDLGRRAERSYERGDEYAGVDDESTQLCGGRVALGAEGVELRIGKRERVVRGERVLSVARPDLIDLQAEVAPERVLDDLRLITP